MAKKSAKKNTRKALLEKTTTLLAKTPGLSMKEIAEGVGVGRATLYRYFPTREELIREIALESIAQTNAAVAPLKMGELDSRTYIKKMLKAIIPLGDRFHFLSSEKAAYEDPDVTAQYNQQLYNLAVLVDKAKREGVIALDIPTNWVISVLDALVWASWDSVYEGYTAQEDIAEYAFRTLLEGVGPKEKQVTKK